MCFWKKKKAAAMGETEETKKAARKPPEPGFSTILDVLRRNAASYGGEVALVEYNPEILEQNRRTWREFELVETPKDAPSHRREITWSDFERQSNQLANLLLPRGIGKGKKVALLLMNCLEWLPAYFGVLKAGAVVVPMNYRYTADEIAYCLRLAEADAFVFGPEFIDRVVAIENNLGCPKDAVFFLGKPADKPDFAEDYLGLQAAASTEDPGIALCDQDHAAIYFSSGTTGFPKAILHNHRALMYACEVEQAHHGQGRDDVFLCIPPLYHTGAKMHWFGSFLAGSRAVILRGVGPEWILEAASDEGATIVWLLVPWAQDILDAIDAGKVDLSKYDLSKWRLMHIGAQPVPPSLIKRWKERFPAHDYDTNYGLSESIGPGCVHLGIENIRKVGAIGIPGYKWVTKIVDEKGEAVEQGSVGELCVKGDGVMLCYYNDPKATGETLRDGWLFTGDMAKQDEDGFIFLVDRKKDVIITGGENIYPVQIEDFLRAHTAVKDVAVIGLPEPRLGEIACAVVEIKEGHACTEGDIEAFCAALPRYKRPRRIVFAPVPRNATGKIEKPKLREQYCKQSLVEAQIV